MSEAAGALPLMVLRGDASAEEVAALAAVLAAKRAAAQGRAAPPSASRWGSPAAKLRGPLRHGPAAWRASARPS